MGLFKTKKKEKAGASDDAASDEAASDIQEAPSHADYKTPKDKKRNKFTFMKAKARKGSSTPADSNNDSTTPRTEASGSTPSSSPSKSISEDELEQEDAGEQDTSTPKKDLLDDLNVVDAYEEEDGGGMELVLGDIPIPSEATEPQTVAEVLIEKTVDRISAELETVDGPDDETSDTEIPEMTKLVQEKLNAVEGKERLISQIKSFDSNDRPQVYEDDSDSDSLADQQAPTPHTTTTATTAEVAAVTPVTPKRSSLPQPDLVTPVGSPNTVLADADEEEERDDANLDRNSTPQAVSKKLLQAFNCTGDMLPEQFQKPIANIRSCATDYTVMSTTVTKVVPKREPIYNDQFAVDFLDAMLNVGFALVSHQPPTEEQADWQGRSVTMLLRPGICNAKETTSPQLEWSTMGGGMAPRVETKSVPLLKIHSVTNSPTNDKHKQGRDDNDDDDEEQERNCFFTLTTNDGQVHVFETTATEESDRLVNGIKNLVARLSAQLISGDVKAFGDFYNNSTEPGEMKFTPEEAMVRLSHSFFV